MHGEVVDQDRYLVRRHRRAVCDHGHHDFLPFLSVVVTAELRDFLEFMAVTAVGKELEKRDARYLSLCCRIAAEMGAHMIKTYYCEEFEKVTKSCPVPIVIAGGPKLEKRAGLSAPTSKISILAGFPKGHRGPSLEAPRIPMR